MRAVPAEAILSRQDVTNSDDLTEREADHVPTADRNMRTAQTEADVIRRSDELQDANRRLRLVVDAATDAFVGMDDAGVITNWNRAAEATFGWSAEEATGRSLADTIHPGAPP